MHKSAYINAQIFFQKYCKENIENKTVLDVGSYNVNGTLKPIFKDAKQYIGMDQFPGDNVDLVSSSHDINLHDNSFDIVVSSSCFEHDTMFWVSILEMVRVCKIGGYVYISAPSNGPYHAHPIDSWRFYADAWKSLVEWVKKNKYNVELVESYISAPVEDVWMDSIGIYKKL